MPSLPQLAPAANCPDRDCGVPIGTKHRPDCQIAICVSTGHQRLIHHHGERRPPVDLGEALVDVHVCGEDVWAGYPHGAVEAAAAGLFVRPATPDAPRTRWVPCTPGYPGAVPDLARVVKTGTWNPVRQVWEIPEASNA